MVKHFSSRLSPGLLAIFVVAGLSPAAVARAAETPAKNSAPPKAAAHFDQATSKPSVEPAAPREADAAKEPAAETSPSTPEKLRFQFRFQPWKDVLDWFAKQADLSLVADVTPPGTFNYSDTHEYTPTEAIDLLNSVLLTKGYTLIRRNRMLMLVNLEDGIPANLVSTVPVNSLDGRGEFEVVRVIFDLEKLKPEEVEGEIKKLLGPQGSVVPLGRSRQVAVTETASRLRVIRTMLARMEGADGTLQGGLRAIELKFARSDDVLPIVRQMLEIPDDKNVSADGSIRIALEAGGGRLFVSGQPDKVARAVDIIKGLDVPAPGADAASRIGGTPQLEIYPISNADAEAALSVLKVIMAGQPDLRLMVDPKTNNLVALARPAQHATIRAFLAQLQREGQHVEVIRLTRLDPETVLASINKLFPAGDASKGTQPLVDADSESRQLMIRGTESQISQIRGMLEKMGERLTGGGSEPTQRGRVRTLTLSDANARSALEKIQEIWPTLRPNRIRIVGPTGAVDEPPGNEKTPQGIPPAVLERLRELKRAGSIAPKGAGPEEKPSGDEKPRPREPASSPPVEHSTRLSNSAPIVYVAEQRTAEMPAEAAAPAPIVVMPGPHGLVIASEDTEALDEFERLLGMLGESGTANHKVSVFYLKYAKAADVTTMLGQIMAGPAAANTTPAASAPGGDGGNPMMGMFGGGPFGGMGGPFGGGGRRNQTNAAASSNTDGATTATVTPSGSRAGLATGPIKITADQRLNALLVRANRADLETIDQLLKVLDQKESPEDVSVSTKPRMIAVENSPAQEIADIVKEVYADRLVENPSANARGGFFAMMARAGQGAAQSKTDVAKMSLGVDPRTNSLIVAAPDALFEEVRQLVGQLDTAAGEQDQTVRVVTLHKTSPTAIEAALEAIAGSSVQVSRTTAATSSSGIAASLFQPSMNQQQPSYSRRGQSGRGQYGQGQYGQGQYSGGQGQQYGQGQPGQGRYGQGRYGQGQYGQGQSGQGQYGQGRNGQGQYGGQGSQFRGGGGNNGQLPQGGGNRGNGRFGQFPGQGPQ